jgi:hypothetical protein
MRRQAAREAIGQETRVNGEDFKAGCVQVLLGRPLGEEYSRAQ